jgi:hypothetical protein
MSAAEPIQSATPGASVKTWTQPRAAIHVARRGAPRAPAGADRRVAAGGAELGVEVGLAAVLATVDEGRVLGGAGVLDGLDVGRMPCAVLATAIDDDVIRCGGRATGAEQGQEEGSTGHGSGERGL